MFFQRKKNSNAKHAVSSDYRIVAAETARSVSFDGWLDPEVAARQDAAFRELIEQLRTGKVRRDLKVAVETMQAAGLIDPSVLEVGCGSGYYYEIMSHLLKQDLLYSGVDRSPWMIRLAKKNYPAKTFLTADAARLPFSNRSFDVVFNGVSLMHILDYAKAISESARIAKSFCIFHTVPLLQNRPTTMLQKSAYGSPVVEIIFNEQELRALFEANHLQIRSVKESIPYNLEWVLNEKTVTKTYLCEVLPE